MSFSRFDSLPGYGSWLFSQQTCQAWNNNPQVLLFSPDNIEDLSRKKGRERPRKILTLSVTFHTTRQRRPRTQSDALKRNPTAVQPVADQSTFDQLWVGCSLKMCCKEYLLDVRERCVSHPESRQDSWMTMTLNVSIHSCCHDNTSPAPQTSCCLADNDQLQGYRDEDVPRPSTLVSRSKFLLHLAVWLTYWWIYSTRIWLHWAHCCADRSFVSWMARLVCSGNFHENFSVS